MQNRDFPADRVNNVANYAIPLCANMTETLASSFITVEGEEGICHGLGSKEGYSRRGAGRNGRRP
jgi:hypothetical protein